MTAIDLVSEYRQADVDFSRPETLPWVKDCLACELRQKMIDYSPVKVWSDDVKDHFLDQHKIEIVQRPDSDRLGIPIPVKGPNYRLSRAVRFRVIADDSPVKGQVFFDITGGPEQAKALAKIFRDRPDMFTDVAVVTRLTMTTDWEEEA